MESEIFNSLLLYFEGSLSDADSEKISRWIEEDESHKELAREAYIYWTAEQAMKSSRDGSTELALSKVYKRSRAARRRRYSGIYQRIAAVLLIPISTSTLTFSVPSKIQFPSLLLAILQIFK